MSRDFALRREICGHDYIVKTCVTLCRVSSREQAEGFSLDAQEKLLIEYCAKHDLQIVKSYSFSESASGRYIRKKYRDMLSFIESKAVDILVVEKTDRLLRNLSDYAEIRKLVFDDGLEVHFVREGEILSTSSKRHSLQVFGFKALIAEGTIYATSEDSAKGLREKAEEGMWPHFAPYGYDTVDKNMVVNKSEAKLLRIMYKKYIDGESLDGITRYVNSHGFRTRKGSKWVKSSIHRILKNPMYTGHFIWKGISYPGKYEPIFTKEEFGKLVEAMNRPTVHKRTWNLSGLIFTDFGRLMTGELQKGNVYYGGFHNRTSRMYIREDAILEFISPQISGIQFGDFYASQGVMIIQDVIKDMNRNSSSRLREAQKEQRAIEAASNRLLDAFISGIIDKETYSEKSTELKQKKAFYDSTVKQCFKSSEDVREYLTKAIYSFRDIPKDYAESDAEGKSLILKHLVDKIIVNKDKSMQVIWRHPWKDFIVPGVLNHRFDTVRNRSMVRGLRDAIRTAFGNMAA